MANDTPAYGNHPTALPSEQALLKSIDARAKAAEESLAAIALSVSATEITIDATNEETIRIRRLQEEALLKGQQDRYSPYGIENR